jgi:hypothetical protein
MGPFYPKMARNGESSGGPVGAWFLMYVCGILRAGVLCGWMCDGGVEVDAV